MSQKYEWENSEVDLDFTHEQYDGKPSDAIKKAKENILKYLKKGNISQEQKEIYSAIYNALNYYSIMRILSWNVN